MFIFSEFFYYPDLELPTVVTAKIICFEWMKKTKHVAPGRGTPEGHILAGYYGFNVNI